MSVSKYMTAAERRKNQHIGARAKFIRIESGMSGADVARLTGMHQSAIYSLEVGDTRWHWRHVATMARALLVERHRLAPHGHVRKPAVLRDAPSAPDEAASAMKVAHDSPDAVYVMHTSTMHTAWSGWRAKDALASHMEACGKAGVFGKVRMWFRGVRTGHGGDDAPELLSRAKELGLQLGDIATILGVSLNTVKVMRNGYASGPAVALLRQAVIAGEGAL